MEWNQDEDDHDWLWRDDENLSLDGFYTGLVFFLALTVLLAAIFTWRVSL
jgi:hypothetical protein